MLRRATSGEDRMTIDLEQRIRERAYFIWEQEGRVHGRADEHWHRAKFELTAAAATFEAPAAAEPAKKARRAAAPKSAAPVPPAAPRRRRPAATLQ